MLQTLINFLTHSLTSTKFPDGKTVEQSANTITQIMCSQDKTAVTSSTCFAGVYQLAGSETSVVVWSVGRKSTSSATWITTWGLREPTTIIWEQCWAAWWHNVMDALSWPQEFNPVEDAKINAINVIAQGIHHISPAYLQMFHSRSNDIIKS